MPMHLHFLVLTFADQSLGRVINLIKGASAREFLAKAPELRAELGDHLWQEGYHWVEVKTHRQFANTARYIRENRARDGLDEV